MVYILFMHSLVVTILVIHLQILMSVRDLNTTAVHSRIPSAKTLKGALIVYVKMATIGKELPVKVSCFLWEESEYLM